jgi:hypothetical protein
MRLTLRNAVFSRRRAPHELRPKRLVCRRLVRDFGEPLRPLEIIGQNSSCSGNPAAPARAGGSLPAPLPAAVRGQAHRRHDPVRLSRHDLRRLRRLRARARPVRTPPKRPRRAYPVEERHGVVWVWMGDPDRADPRPDLRSAEFSSPAWHAPSRRRAAHPESALPQRGRKPGATRCMSASSTPRRWATPPRKTCPCMSRPRGEVISAWRWIRDAPPIGFFQKFGGFDGNVDRWHYYHLHLPSTAVIDFGSIDTKLNCPRTSATVACASSRCIS